MAAGHEHVTPTQDRLVVALLHKYEVPDTRVHEDVGIVNVCVVGVEHYVPVFFWVHEFAHVTLAFKYSMTQFTLGVYVKK